VRKDDAFSAAGHSSESLTNAVNAGSSTSENARRPVELLEPCGRRLGGSDIYLALFSHFIPCGV